MLCCFKAKIKKEKKLKLKDFSRYTVTEGSEPAENQAEFLAALGQILNADGFKLSPEGVSEPTGNISRRPKK